MTPPAPLLVVYDGECPFCASYVRLMSLRDAVGRVELVDARSDHPAVRQLQSQGIDLNEGMAVWHGEALYYGDDAVVLLSTLSDRKGSAARILSALLRDPARAARLYPWMKRGRRLVLRLLGRRQIAASHGADKHTTVPER